MKRIFAAMVFLFSISAMATDMNVSGLGPTDVVAPSTFGDIPSSDRIQGQIYYDVTAGSFKGINKSGGVDVLSTVSGTPVVSYATGDRIERATVADACSSNPCTVASKTSGINSITFNSTGSYTVNFETSPAAFSAAPACVVTSVAAANRILRMTGLPTTSGVTIQATTAADSAANTGFIIICQGPK